MKFKRGVAWLMVVVLALSVVGCSGSSSKKAAASKGSAQVRFACMFFPLADVSIDGQMALDDMVYPYISRYMKVSAGQHTLRVVSSSGETAAAAQATQVDLNLDEDHSYLIVSYGNLSLQTGHTLKVIDETENLAQMNKDHNLVLFLHLANGAPGLDAYIQDQRVMENITYGQALLYSMPVGKSTIKVTLANIPSVPLYTDEPNGLANTYTVVAALGTILKPTLAMDIYSTLNLMDLLAQIGTAGYYDTWQQMLQKSGMDKELAGPEPFTLFAAWDSDFMNVPLNEIMADPAKLKNVVSYNIVPESVLPYVLYHRTQLATLQGTPLTVTPIDSGQHFMLNGSGKVYQNYHASNGELYEVDEFMMPPTP